MRLKGRPGRFLAVVIGGWCAARAVFLWPHLPALADEPAASAVARLLLPGLPWPHEDPAPDFVAAAPRMSGHGPRNAAIPRPAAAPVVDPGPWERAQPGRLDRLAMMMLTGGEPPSTHQLLRRAVFLPAAEAAPSPPPFGRPSAPADERPEGRPERGGSRIEAQAYLFLRPGSGRALALGGTLGGSQAAVRIAVPVAGSGHVALAARAYRPLATDGGEAAVGIDWRPKADAPLRVSVERRQRLDGDGRSAWSAYAAGGLYREIGGWRLDGYAQAGVVGVRSRDLFADGAIRATRPLTAGPVVLEAGGGLWAAAQPGARRIDVGPRMLLRLPVAAHAISLAAEARVRVGGDARPGSGLVLTLAADL